VFCGRGEGARYIELPWVKRQIVEKLGFTPFPGTLNVRLTKEELRLKDSLGDAGAIEISPAKGFGRGRCFKAIIMRRLKCAVVIPEIPSYPEDVIEVTAAVNLRKKLGLEDGDCLEIEVLFE
jgi:riboflavin kinase